MANSGPGSLREAISAGNRFVTFAVGGTIVVSDYLYVGGPNITIDFCSAPAPGITVTGRGLVIRGTRGANDVIVRCYRGRNSPVDGIQIASASRVVIDRASVLGWNDGAIDITVDSRDVTIQHSIIGRELNDPAPHEHCMLIKYGVWRVTLWRNFLVNCDQRNPQFRWDSPNALPDGAGLQMINNVVVYTAHGLLVYGDEATPRVNAEGNYFQATASTDIAHGIVTISPVSLYTNGNVAGEEGRNPNQHLLTGNAPTPHAAPAVPTVPACEAAPEVLADVGPTFRTAEEQALVDQVTLSGCP